GEHQKGQELFEAGQFAEAAEELTRSIRKDGPTYWKHYYRGLAHFKLRKNNAAIVDFKQAIRLDTEHPSAYFSLGYTYHALKSDNEALKNYNLAIAKVDIYALTDETRTVAAKSYFNRGILYGGFKQFQDAINDFSTSIQIDGSFGDSYYRRGVFRLVLSQGQQGCDDILVGLQKGSADHYNMGQECQQK
ncbi:MAG: tetratricopeptide repeat protein, partial [Bacteroidota bacterium]